METSKGPGERQTENRNGEDAQAKPASEKVLALTAFTFIWGQLQAAHVMKDLSSDWRNWPALPTAALLLMIPAVVQPRTALALPLMAAASEVYLLLHGSRSNHIMLDLLVNLAILLASIPDFRLDAQHYWRLAAIVHRELVALYMISAVHKLNTDWFKPEVSCASAVTGMLLAQHVPTFFPAHSAATSLLLWASPYAAAILELLLPILLAIAGPPGNSPRHRTCEYARRLGVGVAALFHFGLALPLPPSSFYPFSASCLAMLILEVPDALDALATMVRTHAPTAYHNMWMILPGCLALPACANAGKYFSSYVRDGHTSGAAFEYPPYDLFDAGICWTFGLTILLLCLAAISPGTGRNIAECIGGSFSRRCAAAASGVCLCLQILIGFSPYLGLRTYPAFAMFSNLRVEGSAPNHLLFGGGLDLFGFQRDAVHILDTDVPALQSFQVDLAVLYLPQTTQYLNDVGIHPTLWICPPRWRYPPPPNFTAYSAPAVEIRRRLLAVEAAAASGAAREMHTRAIWHGQEIILRSSSDLELNCAGRLPVWACEVAQRMVGPFRSFDEAWSPCRH